MIAKTDKADEAGRTGRTEAGARAEAAECRAGSARPAFAVVLVSLMSALSALSALSVPSAPLFAQSLAGRYRLIVTNLEVGRFVGDLRLEEQPSFRGTLLLSTTAGDPVPLNEASRSSDGEVTFAVQDVALFRFRGRMGPRGLSGAVTAAGDSGRWSAERIQDGIEFYPVLPRLVLRQIIGGRGDSILLVPGPLRVAARNSQAVALDSAYQAAAIAARLTPITNGQRGDGARRALGRADRAATVRAAGETLLAMRGALPSDDLRRRFDAVFRPRREWLVDLHSAALYFARLQSPGLSWEAVMPALVAERWVPAADSLATVPDALSRLRMLRTRDAATYDVTLRRMAKAHPSGTANLKVLLEAYPRAEEWHRTALTFLLKTPWVPLGTERVRPAELVASLWDSVVAGDRARAEPVPAIASRLFGQPQAVPRIAPRHALIARMIRADNWTGAQWLAQHSDSDLIGALQQLPNSTDHGLFFVRRGEQLRVTPVSVQVRTGLNGVLEPADVIDVDPEYMPLLAVGAVLHEWGHVLAESWRAEHRSRLSADSTIEFAPTDPYIAEGWAELWTDRLLSPLARAYPLLGLTEPEKRVRLAHSGESEPHATGYLVVRAGVSSAQEVPGLLRRLLDADSLRALRQDPAYAALWSAGINEPDLVLPTPGLRYVIPELTFTIEDQVADPVKTTLRAE